MPASVSPYSKARKKKAAPKATRKRAAAKKKTATQTKARAPKATASAQASPATAMKEEARLAEAMLEDELEEAKDSDLEEVPVTREEIYEELHEELLDMLEAIPAEALTEGWPKDEDSLYEKAFLREMLNVLLRGGYDGNDYVMRAVLRDEFRELLGEEAYQRIEDMDRALAAGTKHHLQVAVELNNFFRQQRFGE